jgi:hypothetical protein
MTSLALLELFTTDVAEAAELLDHEGDADGFARALASFIETAGGSIPVMVDDDGTLVVRTTAGDYRLTIAGERSGAPPRVD